MEQELLTLPEHLSSPQAFSGVRVARSLVLCVCFVDRCLPFCPISFGHCVVWFFLDIRILITPLVSSNSSCQLCCICFVLNMVSCSSSSDFNSPQKTAIHLSYTSFKIDCYKRLRHPTIWQTQICGYVQMNINVNNQSMSVSFVIIIHKSERRC